MRVEYICTLDYYSAMKKNEIMSFEATWVDLEVVVLTEISQKKRQILCDVTHMWNLKK